jgi:carboxymethylenebutenolidase
VLRSPDEGLIEVMPMGDWVELADGVRAYEARPPLDAAQGVLLLHAWWGLNPVMLDMADRLAASGFRTLAPDLYGGLVVTTVEDAEREVERVDMAERMEPAEAAAAHLVRDVAPDGPGIGVIGFSLGAFYAIELAALRPEVRAAVLCYGTGQRHDWSASRASFLGHFAEHDPFEPIDDVRDWVGAVEAGGRPFELHVHPGTGHWFMEPDRDAYDPAASERAWDRTIGFLNETLRAAG